MVRYSITIATLCIISACSCGKVLEDDMLTLDRMPNDTNALKLNGYYFSEFDSNEPRYRVYFLYQNGTILYGASPPVADISEREELYRNGEYYNLAKDNKDIWGVYQIDGNEIKIERWYPGEPPLEVFIRSGVILNDTTFYITKSFKPDGSEEKARDELYHFKVLSPKPDSTNAFIE